MFSRVITFIIITLYISNHFLLARSRGVGSEIINKRKVSNTAIDRLINLVKKKGTCIQYRTVREAIWEYVHGSLEKTTSSI